MLAEATIDREREIVCGVYMREREREREREGEEIGFCTRVCLRFTLHKRNTHGERVRVLTCVYGSTTHNGAT